MKVGFVGLGHMGSGMAASLLKAGHEVIVYNRTRGKAEPLIAQGARVVASVADACRESAVSCRGGISAPSPPPTRPTPRAPIPSPALPRGALRASRSARQSSLLTSH
jgi:UDP-N-acetylmuramoylalanine-D-glutamate ligase